MPLLVAPCTLGVCISVLLELTLSVLLDLTLSVLLDLTISVPLELTISVGPYHLSCSVLFCWNLPSLYLPSLFRWNLSSSVIQMPLLRFKSTDSRAQIQEHTLLAVPSWYTARTHSSTASSASPLSMAGSRTTAGVPAKQETS